MMTNKISFLLPFLASLLIQSCKQSSYTPPEDALFIQIKSSESGIGFSNDITDDSIFNETTYRNFYNGGGVAIGDINNDGLADIFMTANQGQNKLYLNKGNFKFEDVTNQSGIVKHHQWSTGVTMADVNADGLLDIYVCAAGNLPGDARKNELYINKGNLRFEEQADKFGLADEGAFHTQAAFFDYDLDGDLDAYLLNNDCNVPTSSFPDASFRKFRSANGGDKLLNNNNGYFTDVSEAAGIYSVSFGFGLGVAVGDINGDLYPDIYISNDFFEKDYLYINQQDGTFLETSDTSIGHMSQSSMGADIADINNDGLIDIFSTDMLPEGDYRLKKNTRFDDYNLYHSRIERGYHRQLLSNMLHVNNGNNTFSEVANYAGVQATDWSWGALVFDMNNDGWKDILVCNGMYLDVTDNDYIDFIANDNRATFQREKSKVSSYEILKSMTTSVAIPNYAFINNRNLSFSNNAHQLGLGEPGFSNGAAYGDLDNDGDLDIVINNLNSTSFVYKNKTSENLKQKFLRIKLKGDSSNTFATGATVTVYASNTKQTIQNFPTRGFQSSSDQVMCFGLGNASIVDSVVAVWPNHTTNTLRKVKPNTDMVVAPSLNDTKHLRTGIVPDPLFREAQSLLSGNLLHKENLFNDFDRERLMPHQLSREGPKIVTGDINGDNLVDFIVGAAKHDTTKAFIQNRNGTFRQVFQSAFATDENYEDAGMALFDADNDGDKDLLVASGGNLDGEGSVLLHPRLYLNNGKGVFQKSDQQMPDISVNASCVSVNDFDKDGFMDVFIGGRSVPGQYGITPNSYLLKNTKGKFMDVTEEVAPQLRKAGMVTDAVWMDVNEDSIDDLVVVGEWMPITIYKNYKGKLAPNEYLNKPFTETNGWWNCIESADIDNDGDLDLIAGNLGLNSKIKADSLHPVQLYVNDFDKNGTTECILTYFKSDGKSYPYYLKPDITAQMPTLKKQFLKHASFAGKTIDQIFSKQQLEASTKKQANFFSSSFIINKGNGEFEVKPLPPAVQLSPAYGIVIDDFNKDRVLDVFLVGNFTGLKPELGRYDASFGVMLRGKGNGDFNVMSTQQTGLTCPGEGRDVVSVSSASGKKLILVSRNNQELLMFRSK